MADKGRGTATDTRALQQGIQKMQISQPGGGPAPTVTSGTIQQTDANGQPQRNPPVISYSAEKVIGHGSFGVVFLAKVVQTGEVVAIKKVLQDKRFKNRELQIMRMLNHPNIVAMKHCFYSNGDKTEEVYLNLVLEFIPDNVYRFARHFHKNAKEHMPQTYVKVFVYQLCRALHYLHSAPLNICHRDIKPHNLLIHPETGVLKLCDFGSAKQLIRGEPNVAYICSRYYRAPELIFGCSDYTTAIDVWSLGCVTAELLLGQPLFRGESSVDQLVEIIKVLGTPTQDQIRNMNPNYCEFQFPNIKPHAWQEIFRSREGTPQEGINLVSQFLEYTPTLRISPVEACIHPFFDELRDPNTRLAKGKSLPPLFNFSPEELKYLKPEQKDALVPPHARQDEE